MRLTLAILLILQLGCRIYLLANLNVHWDEFHFLSQIYEYNRGTLAASLQTFHVHLFSWLTAVPGDEIQQIILGRSAMLCLDLLSLTFLYYILARRFATEAIFFAFLGYQTLLEVSLHGASFRSDPILLVSFTASLLLLPKKRSSFLSGALFALAAVCNLKAALLLGWFWLYVVLVEPKPMRWWLEQSCSFAIFGGLLFALHRASLATPAAAGAPSALADVFSGFLLAGLSRAGVESLTASFLLNPAVWAFALCGLYAALRSRTNLPLTAAALFGPLICLVYRNAWPYFLPVALVFISVHLAAMYGFLRQGWARAAFAGVLFVSFAVHFWSFAGDGLADQELVLDTVHELFPEPVPYVDRGGMVASYPSAGPLLSTWVIEREAKRGAAIFTAERLEVIRPRFMILNSPALNDPVLADYFIRLWGPLYVPRDFADAGKLEKLKTELGLEPAGPLYRY